MTRALFIFCLYSIHIYSADLSRDNIFTIMPKKTSRYIKTGIFHSKGDFFEKEYFFIEHLRHFYKKSLGYERLVFQFNAEKIPKIYGSILMKKKKIFIDFFKSKLKDNLTLLGQSKFVRSVKFYPIRKDTLSVEISLKNHVLSEIFYLTSPGRFVIDLKLFN